MRESDAAGSEYPVFAVADRVVSVGEVVDAAYIRGELEPCWTRFIQLLECEKNDARYGDPDEHALQASLEEWRYDRDLITAEEAEAWLQNRGVSIDQLSKYLVRNSYTQTTQSEAEPASIDYMAASPELRDMLRIDLLLSGEFDRMAIQLSWRLIASLGGNGDIPAHLLGMEQANFLERAGIQAASLPEWLARFGRDRQWLDRMFELEVAFVRRKDSLLTALERERALAAFRLPLMRLDLEVIELDSLEPAREAFLCVHDDGASMEQVAKLGRYPYRKVQVLFEELAADTQQAVLSAVPGEVLDPIQQGEGYQLLRLLRKDPPSLADDSVRTRVERHIVECHFSELAARHVRWMMPPSATNDTARR